MKTKKNKVFFSNFDSIKAAEAQLKTVARANLLADARKFKVPLSAADISSIVQKETSFTPSYDRKTGDISLRIVFRDTRSSSINIMLRRVFGRGTQAKGSPNNEVSFGQVVIGKHFIMQ